MKEEQLSRRSFLKRAGQALAGATLVTAIATTQPGCPQKYDLPLDLRVGNQNIPAQKDKRQLEDIAKQLSIKVDGRDGLLDDMIAKIIGDQKPEIKINNYTGDIIPSTIPNYQPNLTTAKITYKSKNDYNAAVKMLQGEAIGKSGKYIHLADNFRGKGNTGMARVTGEKNDTLLQLLKYDGKNKFNANGVDFLGVAYSPKDNSLILYCSDTSVNSLEDAHLNQFNTLRAGMSLKPLDTSYLNPLGINKQVKYKK
jgi:hypothetical protein